MVAASNRSCAGMRRRIPSVKVGPELVGICRVASGRLSRFKSIPSQYCERGHFHTRGCQHTGTHTKLLSVAPGSLMMVQNLWFLSTLSVDDSTLHMFSLFNSEIHMVLGCSSQES